ncbi:MAG: hypothetical protein F6K31_44175 [Symploca sp. SIO2G7]|nr:hypothetical protein [Symploca sp. SIO2G7]
MLLFIAPNSLPPPIESLEEYVLIAPDQIPVECRRRLRDEGKERWETEVYGAGERVILRSVELEVVIEALYRGVSFSASIIPNPVE